MSFKKLFVLAYLGPFCLMSLTLWALWENNWNVDPLVMTLGFASLMSALWSATAVDGKTRAMIRAVNRGETYSSRLVRNRQLVENATAMPLCNAVSANTGETYEPGDLFHAKM